MGPKEDPVVQRERERERRRALLDRRKQAQENADQLTTDLSSVYGLGGMSLFGMSGQAGSAPRKGKTGSREAR